MKCLRRSPQERRNYALRGMADGTMLDSSAEKRRLFPTEHLFFPVLERCEKSPMNEGRIWIQPIILKTNISDEKWSKQYYYSQLLSLFFRVVRRFKSELSFFFLYVHKYLGGREVVDVTVPIISQTAFEWETPTLYLLDRDLESN